MVGFLFRFVSWWRRELEGEEGREEGFFSLVWLGLGRGKREIKLSRVLGVLFVEGKFSRGERERGKIRSRYGMPFVILECINM